MSQGSFAADHHSSGCGKFTSNGYRRFGKNTMFEKKIVFSATLSIIALCLSRSVALNRDETARGGIKRELENEVWQFATRWALIESGPLATYVDRGKTSRGDRMIRLCW
jgi:HKD family nuclease